MRVYDILEGMINKYNKAITITGNTGASIDPGNGGYLYVDSEGNITVQPEIPAVDIDGEITGEQIAPRAITTNHLAANAITTVKIADSQITASKLARNAINLGDSNLVTGILPTSNGGTGSSSGVSKTIITSEQYTLAINKTASIQKENLKVNKPNNTAKLLGVVGYDLSEVNRSDSPSRCVIFAIRTIGDDKLYVQIRNNATTKNNVKLFVKFLWEIK